MKTRRTATQVEMENKAKSQHAMELSQGQLNECATINSCPVKFILATNDDKFVNRSELEQYRIHGAVPDAVSGFMRLIAATDERRIESIEFVVNFEKPDPEVKDRA